MPSEKSKLRILMITGRADLGGGPEHIYQLVRNLPADIETYIAAPRQEPYWYRFSELVGAQRMIEIPSRRIRIGAARKIIAFVRSRQIQLVHSHGRPAAIYATLCRRFSPCFSVSTPHGAFAHGLLKKPLFRLIDRICARHADHIIAVSHTEEKEWRKLLRRNKCISTIFNGVPVGAFSLESEPQTIPRRILHVTRFVHQKNSLAVLEILVALKERGALDRFHLDVAGDGPGKDEFLSTVSKRGLIKAVTCYGAMDSIRPLIRKAFCVLSTSRWEGLPLALLEAMAVGVPAVASCVVGNTDVVSEESGFLFALGDAATAAGYLLELENPERWHRCSAAAKNRISQHYSVERMATETAGLYRRVCSNAAATS